MIPNRWNDTPRFPSGMERKNASAARDYVDDLHIAHITGHFTNRYHLVSDIAARFEEIRQ